MKFKRIALILLGGAALGSAAVMTRLGIQEIPPLYLILMRFTVTTAAFALTIAVTRPDWPGDRRTWIDIAITGVTNVAIPVVAFTFALQTISSGVFGLMLALYPLLTAVGAHFLFDHEKMTRARLVGMALACGGTLLLILTGTTGLRGEMVPDWRGYALVLLGDVVGASSLLYMRHRLRDANPTLVTAGQVLVTLPVVLPFALATGALDLSAVTWRGWFAVGFSGLVGSFLGYLLLVTLTKQYGATSGALPGYVMPVAAAALGALTLGEVITGPLMGGAALIMAGVFLASRS